MVVAGRGRGWLSMDMTSVSDRTIDLGEWVDRYRSYSALGSCADYIPALRKADPSQLGICMLGADGTIVKAGETESPFTIQSISKVIGFMAACLSCGIDTVLEYVDVEPTGDAFNSIVRLELHKPGRPFNPMINAGAITIASMQPGTTAESKLEGITALLEALTGKSPTYNREVFQSEWQTAHRNRALAYCLKEMNCLQSDVEVALEVYLKQCSLEVTVEDLAAIGMILGCDGYDPVRKKQVVSKDIARITKALMLTCGMYNASGKFAAFVGVPAKSGVSGGIMAAVPPRAKSRELPFPDGCGIGIYGPAIDKYGNSTAGHMLLKHIAQAWDLSVC